MCVLLVLSSENRGAGSHELPPAVSGSSQSSKGTQKPANVVHNGQYVLLKCEVWTTRILVVQNCHNALHTCTHFVLLLTGGCSAKYQ